MISGLFRDVNFETCYITLRKSSISLSVQALYLLLLKKKKKKRKKVGVWRICNEPLSPGTRPGTWRGIKFINQTVFRGMKQQTLKAIHQTALPNGSEGAESAGCFRLLFFSEKSRKRYAEPDKLTPGAQGKLQACRTLQKKR